MYYKLYSIFFLSIMDIQVYFGSQMPFLKVRIPKLLTVFRLISFASLKFHVPDSQLIAISAEYEEYSSFFFFCFLDVFVLFYVIFIVSFNPTILPLHEANDLCWSVEFWLLLLFYLCYLNTCIINLYSLVWARWLTYYKH